MTKSVAIVQPNYIPWRGYFDLIDTVDEFILLEDIQYTARDWRNRNLIKTRHGLRWLTIPCRSRHHRARQIRDIRVVDGAWAARHWKTITHAYAGARHFGDYRDRFEARYAATAKLTRLSAIDAAFLKEVCDVLGISTAISSSTRYPGEGTKTDRLLSICRTAGAGRYVTGPAAAAYLETAKFDHAGIELCTIDYAGYPDYRQRFGPFEPRVSVLDLIFNEGPAAPRFLKCVPHGDGRSRLGARDAAPEPIGDRAAPAVSRADVA